MGAVSVHRCHTAFPYWQHRRSGTASYMLGYLETHGLSLCARIAFFHLHLWIHHTSLHLLAQIAIYTNHYFFTLSTSLSQKLLDSNEFDFASVLYLRVTALEPRCGLRIHYLPTSTRIFTRDTTNATATDNEQPCFIS
jgi:hypothetical protein